MADTEQVRNAGRRLATDLRDLRETRKIKSESIIEATRLTEEVFERFDESALVDHPAFNRVYLRSVVASYARVLEIDEDLACRGLEEALDGTYAGGLRRVYIDGLPVEEWAERSENDDEQSSDESAGRSEASGHPADHESESAKTRQFRIGASAGSRRLIALAIIIIGISIAIVLLTNRDPTQNLDETGEAETIVPVPPPEPEWILLGDSIRFDIVATSEKLDPIRVKVDSGMRRPYWIEHLDTLSFFVKSNVIFERELDVADIFMDGRLLPDTMINSSGQMEITRERAQAWLDSLAIEEAARNRPLS